MLVPLFEPVNLISGCTAAALQWHSQSPSLTAMMLRPSGLLGVGVVCAVLLAAAPVRLVSGAGFGCGPTCFQNSTCQSNAESRIAELTAASPALCCAACTKKRGCKSWTYFGQQQCYLFSSESKRQHGPCTSGNGKVVPPPHSPWVPPPPYGPVCKDCPNIIFSLTDDQDTLLGGWDPMTKTRARLQQTGATLVNWRIHTPICSPSRSETVSGRYFHNIKSNVSVPPPHVLPAATAHVNGTLYLNESFGVYLREQRGYQVGMFGKSNFNTMQGFDRWFEGVIVGYGGKWQDNEQPGFYYYANSTEYATSLIGNKTTEWLSRDNVTGASSHDRPFFVYFAPHCPHIPATPPDWYADACPGVKAPRPPNYNYSAPTFHELISRQPPLNSTEANDIDALARLRCQCLLSVDDAHDAILNKLEELGSSRKTYWFISSDHGYNLGNHRLPSNKFLLYDHSLRIPMVVNGPGVQAAAELPVLGTNVDYAPTWLGLADIDTPEVMDGKSLVHLLVNASDPNLPGSTKRHLEKNTLSTDPQFRKAQFHQYYNQGPWQPNDPLDGLGRWLDDYSNTYIGLTILDPTLGNGHYKYGEYQYNCSTEQLLSKTCFNDPDWFELFDLTADPYELENIYQVADPALKLECHDRLRQHYPCKGPACP